MTWDQTRDGYPPDTNLERYGNYTSDKFDALIEENAALRAHVEKLRPLEKAANEYRAAVIAVVGPVIALDEVLAAVTVDNVQQKRDALLRAALADCEEKTEEEQP